MSIGTRIFLDVNDFARDTPWLHPIMSGYANFGVVLFALLLLSGWWIARERANPALMAAALWAPLGMLVALGINQPVAAAVGETRPCNALHGIVVLHCAADASFPSDHAVMAGAVTAGLWLVNRRLGVLAALAAVMMAFARVYIAAHYLQDVLAGLVLGAAVSLLGFLLVRPLIMRLLALAADSPLRIVLTSATPGESLAGQRSSR